MASIINTNMASINAQRSLAKTQSSLQESMARLSSGLRVNSAKDDAAGMAIANRMSSQIRGMTVASRNANDGISMAQAAESAMEQITDAFQRMRDLAVQALNGGAVGSGDRQKLQTEFKQLGQEVKRIIDNTQFNGKKVLAGSLQGVNFQVGWSTAVDNQISITISNFATVSGVMSLFGDGKSIGSVAGSAAIRSTVNSIDVAINKVDTFRATLGAAQNRFSATVSNLASAIEAQSAAKSRIMDADFAAETANLARSQVLQQAGTAMLAQANQQPSQVLSLLK
jgi:flagellin